MLPLPWCPGLYPGAAAAVMAGAMQKMAVAGSGKANRAQLQAMKMMLDNMFGGSMPTLGDIVDKKNIVTIRSSSNVREAASIMAEKRNAILVIDDDELVGIFTPKDLLNRVVAADKSPDLTSVATVMTPNPDCVGPEVTLLDALREMHDHKYLHLPVRDDSGVAAAVAVGVVVALRNRNN